MSNAASAFGIWFVGRDGRARRDVFLGWSKSDASAKAAEMRKSLRGYVHSVKVAPASDCAHLPTVVELKLV